MALKILIPNPYFLAALSGILLVLSFPPFNFYFLAWIALVPFLYALATSPFEKQRKWRVVFRRASTLGLVLGVILCYGTLHWLGNIFGFIALPLIGILSLFFFLYAFFLKYILSRWRYSFALPISAPIVWIAIEYFRSEGWWLKFSWMSLGYSQHSFLPVLQCASIFGQYGISFLIVLVNATIVFLILNRSNRKLFIGMSTAVLLLSGLIVTFGIISMRERYDPSIRVGLVQDESSDFTVYAELTEKLPGDVDFVLWPEYALPEFVEEEPELKSRIEDLTVLMDSYLIVGAKDRAERYSSMLGVKVMQNQGASESDINELFKFHNTAYLFSPDGDIIDKYYKTNPIQFFADGVAGTEFPSFQTKFGRIGIFICYDADYSYVARRITQSGAEMLFIPTYDHMSWSELQHKQHSAMTSMRAVENGRYIARATTSGISQIIDPKGRVLRSIGIGESAAIVGLIDPIDRLTFYTRFGFLLPYVCIMASLALCLRAFAGGSNSRQED
jgi:apolipoprotein N-acyltransferase